MTPILQSVTQRVLQSWPGILPPIVYVQRDNMAIENKNSMVFGYLSRLVEKDIFKKIKVNFMLIGHIQLECCVRD